MTRIKMIFSMLIVSILALPACISPPISSLHWQRCEDLCRHKGGVLEAQVEAFQGEGCRCNNEELLWLRDIEPAQGQ